MALRGKVIVTADVEVDEVNPDVVRAMTDYIIGALEERAAEIGKVLNWSKLDVWSRQRGAKYVITGKAPVLA